MRRGGGGGWGRTTKEFEEDTVCSSLVVTYSIYSILTRLYEFMT